VLAVRARASWRQHGKQAGDLLEEVGFEPSAQVLCRPRSEQ
jgi:hypothetical protein